MEEKQFWVGFNLVRGIGAVRTQQLIDTFGCLEAAWAAPVELLTSARLPEKVVSRVVEVRKTVDLDRLYSGILEKGIQILTWEDEDYPERLRDIDQPPPVLYVRGEITSEDRWSIAVVGTRRMTSYGRQVADDLGIFLARNGVTVVSGLARGVDVVAHKAALQGGGRTIAVLGSGVDVIYPPEHRSIVGEIINNGALVSDYPPGTPPEGQNFPPRNRIISGLSIATIVVEAGLRSGALITAKFALDQGHEVFAIPGTIHGKQSAGANQLISDGAHPLLRFEELLEILQIEKVPEQRQARKTLPVNDMEKKMLSLLDAEPLHVDEIGNRSGLPIAMVTATLTVMELKGLVRHLGGMKYHSVRESRSDYLEAFDA